LDGATVSAKPRDVFIRPYECYSCNDFMRCEESCWRSVRISPWYVQPCGIRKDNLYWYHEENPYKLREQLADGGKLSRTVVNHDAYFERVQEVVADDTVTRHPFIVIEGPDGSGKTTITKKLAQTLGFIPYRTPPNVFQVDTIKTALERPGLEFARFLYYMASNYCASPEIRSLLIHCGVVCDRWILSTTLYHKIALGVDVPLPLKLIKELVRPDLVIILDVSETTQAARLTGRQAAFDASWEQTPLIREAIKEGYDSETGADIVHVPCDGTVDEVVGACLNEINKRELAPAVHA
jgi:dTMP kinase